MKISKQKIKAYLLLPFRLVLGFILIGLYYLCIPAVKYSDWMFKRLL